MYVCMYVWMDELLPPGSSTLILVLGADAERKQLNSAGVVLACQGRVWGVGRGVGWGLQRNQKSYRELLLLHSYGFVSSTLATLFSAARLVVAVVL